MNETYNPIELECHNPLTLKQRPPANENRPPAADKTPQVCHTTWEVYIKEKPFNILEKFGTHKKHYYTINWT